MRVFTIHINVSFLGILRVPRSFSYRKISLNQFVSFLANQRNYPCKINGCQAVYNAMCSLKKHRRVVHSCDPFYYCDFCPERDLNKMVIRNHLVRFHMSPLSWDFSCDICGRKFCTKAERNLHAMKCSFDGANESSVTQYHRRGIFKKATDPRNEKVDCEKCEKTFCNGATYIRHMKLHESKLQV